MNGFGIWLIGAATVVAGFRTMEEGKTKIKMEKKKRKKFEEMEERLEEIENLADRAV